MSNELPRVTIKQKYFQSVPAVVSDLTHGISFLTVFGF